MADICGCYTGTIPRKIHRCAVHKAAPDMLAALEGALSEVNDVETCDLPQWAIDAEAAIRKARGEGSS